VPFEAFGRLSLRKFLIGRVVPLFESHSSSRQPGSLGRSKWAAANLRPFFAKHQRNITISFELPARSSAYPNTWVTLLNQTVAGSVNISEGIPFNNFTSRRLFSS
jgi:hypothetical protein